MSSVAPTDSVQHDTPVTDSADLQLAVSQLVEEANPGVTPSKLSNQKQQVLGSNGICLITPARFDPSSGKFKEVAPRGVGLDPRLQSLYAEAKSRAPRCGRAPLNEPLQWMSVAQAASTFGMDKRIISKLASQGAIASVKGFGNNAHRLIHFDNMFAWLQDSILRGDSEPHKQPAAAADVDSEPIANATY